MAVEPFQPIYRENVDTVRERLMSALPDELSRVEGSYARDITEVSVFEFVRLWDEMNRYLSYMFPSYAYGQLLDAHAASYGLERGQGHAAKTVVRFIGTTGTPIPANTIVSVPSADPDTPRAFYQTTNTSSVPVTADGYVELDALATSTGVFTNQAADAISLLNTPIDGITSVTNPGPAVGGEDPEDDDLLRERVLLAASLPSGAGSKIDYVRWALEIPGVSEVTVEPLWDKTGATPGSGSGNGTVRLSVRGPNYAPVDWGVLQEVQKAIDPTRQMIALTEEGESWTAAGGTLTWDTTNVQAGASAPKITTAGAGTATVTLTREMDLSRFIADDAVHLWLYSSNWALVSDTSYIRLAEDGSNYFQATLADASGTTARPTTGSSWWLYRVKKSDLEVAAGNGAAGAPSWSAIDSIQLGLIATGAVSLTADYWSMRSVSGAAGEGRAPIGAAVTVVTPVPRAINVSASILAASGYTLSGAPGTTDLGALLRDRLTGFLLISQPGQLVRVVDVANVIHDTPGVVDFTLTTPAANVLVSMHEYATLGTLTLGSL